MANSAPDKSSRDAFIRQLPDRVLAIEENWQSIGHGRWEAGGFSSLYDRLRELSDLCRRHDLSQAGESLFSLETYLSSFLSTQEKPSIAQVDEIDGLLRALKAAAGAARAALPAMTTESVSVFFLTRGGGATEVLAAALRNIGCETTNFSDPDELARIVAELSPQALVADVEMLQFIAPVTAELVRLATHHEIRIPLVFVSGSNALELRVEAMRAGGSAYFVTPLDERAVAAQIRELARPRQELPFRVLIVDDDGHQAEFAATILRKAGMETSTVTEPLRALDSMRAFQPELILMDIYMPDVDGIELTSIIREDNEFIDLPVVFLSGEQNPDKQLSALSVGGDDFITKPIRPKHLVTIVTNRIRRARAMRRRPRLGQIREVEAQSRLVTERQFIDRVAKTLAAESASDEASALLLIEPDGAAALRSRIGIGGMDSLMAEFAGIVVGELRNQDLATKLGDTRLGVFVKCKDVAEVHRLGERLRKQVGGHEFEVDRTSVRVTASVGVCLTDPKIEDVSGLMTRATTACNAAHAAGGNRLLAYQGDEATARQRQVEMDLAASIREAIENDGFQLLFQPLLDVNDGSRDHYDMSLRLLTAQGDPVDPETLRITASRAVLLDRLDRLTIEKGLAVLADRRRQGHETVLFVAQSGLTATDPTLATWLSGRLRSRQIVGTGLVLEFRLPEISDHILNIRNIFGQLREMGVTIGLSRFPAKPVALKVLKFLKADYVRLLDTLAPADPSVISEIVREVHALDAKVIVGGVDDPRTLDKHWSAGADLLLGSFIQRPSESMDFRFEQAVM
jgi:diguanylate cyclase (GGDEF)-like protein